MRKEKETLINAKKLRITQLGFEDGMDLLVMLTKALGPSIGTLATNPEKINQALAELSKQLNPNDLKHVINTLAKTTRINRALA